MTSKIPSFTKPLQASTETVFNMSVSERKKLFEPKPSSPNTVNSSVQPLFKLTNTQTTLPLSSYSNLKRSVTTSSPSKKTPVNQEPIKPIKSFEKILADPDNDQINTGVLSSREENNQFKKPRSLTTTPSSSPSQIKEHRTLQVKATESPPSSNKIGILFKTTTSSLKDKTSTLLTKASDLFSTASKEPPYEQKNLTSPTLHRREVQIVRNSVATSVQSPSVVPMTPLLKGEWTTNFNDLDAIFHQTLRGPVFSGGTYFFIQERTSSTQPWNSALEYQGLIASKCHQFWYNFEQRKFDTSTPSFPKDAKSHFRIVCHLEKEKATQVKHETHLLSHSLFPNKIPESELHQYGLIDEKKMKDGLMRVKWLTNEDLIKVCYGTGSLSYTHPQCSLEVALVNLPIKKD